MATIATPLFFLPLGLFFAAESQAAAASMGTAHLSLARRYGPRSRERWAAAATQLFHSDIELSAAT